MGLPSAHRIQQLVTDIPVELVYQLVDAIGHVQPGNWQELKRVIHRSVTQTALRSTLSEFVDQWETDDPELTPASVALALLSAGLALENYRLNYQIEPVWTGPTSHDVPLRRTDQVLLQLIREALYEIHIVSFAVYKAHNIVEALIEALDRGVDISIYLEMPDHDLKKVDFSPLVSLGEVLVRQAHIYTWPLNKRPRTQDGKYGSLHAKFAIMDNSRMLVSSANLTDYAMTLNMELGLLILNVELATRMRQQLFGLVQQGVLQAVSL